MNRANRAFLGRAVRFLAAEAGIRQFLDIGTGIPSANNTQRWPRAWRQNHGSGHGPGKAIRTVRAHPWWLLLTSAGFHD
jgi:hypothetical protein